MELIYLYIRKYENIFEDEEFNFSSNYKAALKGRHLSVDKNEEALRGYYGQNVNNVVMFFGQNGMGKSTLLDILGMKRDDRIRDTYERYDKERKIKSSYFLLYHLYDDYFAFEFVDDSFIRGNEKIENIDMQGDIEGNALYKLPMGTIFKLEDGVFQYCDNIILQWLGNQGIKNKVEYAYITSDRYNTRIDSRHKEYDYLFERKYYLEEKSYQYQYKCFVRLQEIKNELLKERSISIINSIKIDIYAMDREREVTDYLHIRKSELDKILGIKDKIQIQMEALSGIKQEPDKRCTKDKFLHIFYAELIEYYFLEQLVGWSENEGKKIDINNPLPDMENFELEVNSLSEDEIKNVTYHNLMNFQNEYMYLLYMIKRYTDMEGNIDLKSVLKYILTRVEIAAKGTVYIGERKAVLKLIMLLEKLPNHYFKSRKRIIIECDSDRVDEKITDLLTWYDRCLRVRNDEDCINSISKILEIKATDMSEGYMAFLNLISEAVSAMYSLNPGDTLVLLIDEPDRSLHPELSRKFLDTLLDSINQCKDRNIQIVLTSHSPFIVTDILPENVYAIDNKDGYRRIRKNRDTFATNIYYLLMDSFMLENTFGEYSYKKLKNIMELLKSKNEIPIEQLQEIKRIIDRIGEKTVKSKMIQLYKKREEDSRNEIITRLLNETDDNKMKRIKEILGIND